MRAVVFEKFGDPSDVLHAADVPEPQPGPATVRVRMLASPVNPSDLMTVRGVYGKLPPLPATPGYEGVGVVEESGGGLLGRMMTGKRVAVLNQAGGNWSEQVVVPAKQVIPLAKDLTVEQAATFFVNPVTAYVMTRKLLAVPTGEWLVQTAAGSALGRMVIKLAKHEGFRTLCVVRRAEQVEELRREGADAVVAFDPQHDEPEAFRQQVLGTVGTNGVRYAIDPVGGGTGSAVVRCLGERGRMLVYGTLSAEPLQFSPRDLMTHRASVEGFWLGPYMQSQPLVAKLRLVKTITRLVRAGVLASDIGESYPLDRIAEAVRQSEQPGRNGKVLLRIGEAQRKIPR